MGRVLTGIQRGWGAKGGSDSLFQVFTFRLPRLWEASSGREREREKVYAEVQTAGQFGAHPRAPGESRRWCSSRGWRPELTPAKARSAHRSTPELAGINGERLREKMASLFWVRRCGHVLCVSACVCALSWLRRGTLRPQRGESDKDVGFQKRFSM